MIFLKSKKPLSSGQTAIELAIFGAILLFVLGMIVKTNLGYGFNQNNSLRATRMALTASYISSSPLDCVQANGNAAGNGAAGAYNVPCVSNGGRSSAAVLLIEDRIMPEMSNKYGGLDRTPLIVQGAAVMSRNLYMPVFGDTASYGCRGEGGVADAPYWYIGSGMDCATVGYSSDPDYPRMDIFINGKHFPFTLASATWAYLGENAFGTCDTQVLWKEGEDCVSKTKNGHDGRGCVSLLKKTNNHRANGNWCDHNGGGDIRDCQICSGTLNGEDVSHCHNFPLDYRFDLDLSWRGDPPCDAQPDVSDQSTDLVNYKTFSWQWMIVLAANLDEKKVANGKYSVAEGMEGVSTDSGINTSVDIDFDGQEERLIVVSSGKRGEVRDVAYLDYQSGDMDMSYDTVDYLENRPTPGLGKEMRLISRARDGTYLRIEEGKLYTWDPAQQYVRQAQKKDKIDVIEREIQLSNNTGRFCEQGGGVNFTPKRWPLVDGQPNPVEVCCGDGACSDDVGGASNGASSCMASTDSTNVRTCMDTVSNIIYVRSNVADFHGRKWVTKVPDDQ